MSYTPPNPNGQATSPTETLTFAMKATTAGTCAVAINWIEDI